MARGQKSIVVICNLDTRGADILVVRELIAARGHRPLVLDFSMEEPPPVEGDIRCEEVARRGGLAISAVRALYRGDREAAVENQIRGATAIVEELLARGELHGLLGIGGATAALVATRVMRRLPFGLPKVMATPMAAHPAYVGRYVGTSDITMHHTVLDVVAMNPLLRAQIANAVGAVCGMVEMGTDTDIRFDGPGVAVSSFGFAEVAVRRAVKLLEEAGYTPVVFHAQGRGDRAMEEMIAQGRFVAALDLCTGGVVEHLFHGNRDPGPERLGAAADRGIPVVLGPAGLDMLSYGGQADRLAATRERPRYVQDALRIQVRTSAAELRQAADAIAQRLARAGGPVTFMVPMRGWSSLDGERRPLHDPAANAAFVARLKERLPAAVTVREVDLHLYTPEFAASAVGELLGLLRRVNASRA